MATPTAPPRSSASGRHRDLELMIEKSPNPVSRNSSHACSSCGTRSEIQRMPKGWKRAGELVFCGSCWRRDYILRAVVIPIASPLDDSWSDLRSNLRTMWIRTTQAANWMMTQMYSRDVHRTGQEVKKMPPVPYLYLYPEARELFPELPPTTVAGLEHTIQRRYRAARFDVIWVNKAALPTFRYPVPFTVPSQRWSGSLTDGVPVVSVRIADRRYKLRLKGGPQFYRQRKAFEQIVTGAAVAGELAIYERGTSVLVKMVAWFPRILGKGTRNGTLTVRTTTMSLLVAVNSKDERLWIYNGDHLRRWSAEHRRALQRWSEDTKAENRPRPTFAQRRERAAQKFRDRMNSATHEIAAQLAAYAYRRGFATVVYDGREHGFCVDLPWYRLRNLISDKLAAYGIEFEMEVGEDSPEGQHALRSGENCIGLPTSPARSPVDTLAGPTARERRRTVRNTPQNCGPLRKKPQQCGDFGSL